MIVLEAVDRRSGGSLLTWRQEVRLLWWPARLHWLAALILRAGYRRMLRELLDLGTRPTA